MASEKAKKALDRNSPKRGRGRPGVIKSVLQGRAYDFGLSMENDWDVLTEVFLKAESEEEYKQLFDGKASYLKTKFAAVSFALVEKTRKDPKFPKKPKAQQKFLAESFAGRGVISPRRSRDICTEGRKEKKKKHEIKRRDYYIECSCGHEGPALRGACPECGTKTLSQELQSSF